MEQDNNCDIIYSKLVTKLNAMKNISVHGGPASAIELFKDLDCLWMSLYLVNQNITFMLYSYHAN